MALITPGHQELKGLGGNSAICKQLPVARLASGNVCETVTRMDCTSDRQSSCPRSTLCWKPAMELSMVQTIGGTGQHITLGNNCSRLEACNGGSGT